MSSYINKYQNLAAYTADASARDNLGRTISMIATDGAMHYDGKLNPLGLPAFTVRCKFSSGYTPTQGVSRVCVDQTNNIWDVTLDNYQGMVEFQFDTCIELLEILGGNLADATMTTGLFCDCINLTKIHSLDIHNSQRLVSMFSGCSSLTDLPKLVVGEASLTQLFKNCTGLRKIPEFVFKGNLFFSDEAFEGCINVESGILRLYNQIKNMPSFSHENFFKDCGTNTQSGQAELNQIPEDWKTQDASNMEI